MNHTERFNAIMERGKPAKKEKPKQVIVKQIESRENMNALQISLSKCTYTENTVFLPFERLDNCSDVRKALLNAGATYKNNTFIFPNLAEPFINRLMEGDKVNIKKEFQFFATPQKLAQRIVENIPFFDGAIVLEPSAGHGALLDEMPKDVLLIKECIELMPENCEILRKKGYNPINTDFLSIELNKETLNKYDFIVANPPFSKKQDIDHFYYMYKMLKIGGQMDVIVSCSFTFASDKKSIAFRQFLEDSGATCEEIESGEFKESGTNIKTVLITLIK